MSVPIPREGIHLDRYFFVESLPEAKSVDAIYVEGFLVAKAELVLADKVSNGGRAHARRQRTRGCGESRDAQINERDMDKNNTRRSSAQEPPAAIFSSRNFFPTPMENGICTQQWVR